jgi:hypothetical protein
VPSEGLETLELSRTRCVLGGRSERGNDRVRVADGRLCLLVYSYAPIFAVYVVYKTVAGGFQKLIHAAGRVRPYIGC